MGGDGAHGVLGKLAQAIRRAPRLGQQCNIENVYSLLVIEHDKEHPIG
jgi:hypothetical protein